MRTTSPIAGLFGKSPFRPLQEHMKVVEECATYVVPLFEAVEANDRNLIVSIKEKIFTLEEKADDLKNEIRSRLPKSLFMPVDRRDLLDLLNAQDSIADTVQDVAGLVLLRDMRVPAEFGSTFQTYLTRTVDTVRQCGEVINELDELVEAGFRGRAGERVEEMISVLGSLETETDELGMDLTGLLFKIEDTMKPLSVVFWYELIQRVGDIADFAEDVGDRLRLLIAR